MKKIINENVAPWAVVAWTITMIGFMLSLVLGQFGIMELVVINNFHKVTTGAVFGTIISLLLMLLGIWWLKIVKDCIKDILQGNNRSN